MAVGKRLLTPLAGLWGCGSEHLYSWALIYSVTVGRIPRMTACAEAWHGAAMVLDEYMFAQPCSIHMLHYIYTFSFSGESDFWVSCLSLSVCVLQMGGMEAVITGLTDDFKILKRNRKLFTFATAFGTFLIALLCITNVSVYARVLFQSSTLMTITDTSNWWYSQVWMACSVIKWCHCRVEGSNQDRRWKKICSQIWNDQNAPASHTVTDLN